MYSAQRQRTHRGFTEDPQRIYRGLTDDSQRLHQRDHRDSTEDSQRAHRGLAEHSQRIHRGPTEDAQRTHRGFTEDSQRTCRRLTEDSQGSHRGFAGEPQRTLRGHTEEAQKTRRVFIRVSKSSKTEKDSECRRETLDARTIADRLTTQKWIPQICEPSVKSRKRKMIFILYVDKPNLTETPLSRPTDKPNHYRFQQIRNAFFILFDVLNILFYNKTCCCSWVQLPFVSPCPGCQPPPTHFWTLQYRKVSFLANGESLYPHL